MKEDLINLKEEWKSLLPKIDRLSCFVNSKEFDDLSLKEKAIHDWTLKTMRHYQNTISEIIRASKSDDTSTEALFSTIYEKEIQ